MITQNQQQFSFKILNLNIKKRNGLELFYSFGDEMKSFEESFTLKVTSLHDFLFTKITIILCKNNKKISGANFLVKQITNSIFNLNLTDFKNLNTADFYDKKIKYQGSIEFSVEITDLGIKFEKRKMHLPFTSKIVKSMFNKYLSLLMADVFNLAYEIQSGTLKCKIYSILGLISLLIINKLVFNCKGNHSSVNCLDLDCLNYYQEIPRKIAKYAYKCSHYATLAYAQYKGPIIGPKSLRDIDHTNSAVKYILQHSYIHERNILKIFPGSYNYIGYVIFYENNNLIITFRGTSSLNEVFNTLDAEYINFLNGFAHNGFLRIANQFLKSEYHFISRKIRNLKIKKLLLTGHSMGGAIASMTYLILKNDKQYSEMKSFNIKVISFSSPPCVSKDIAGTVCLDVITYNYEYDAIPKLSFGSILDFKYLCNSFSLNFTLISLFFNRKSSIEAKIKAIREYLAISNIHEKLYPFGNVYQIRSVKIQNKYVYKYKLMGLDYSIELNPRYDSIIYHFLSKFEPAFRPVK